MPTIQASGRKKSLTADAVRPLQKDGLNPNYAAFEGVTQA